jgi:AcrR family transcriptional regulator
MAAKKTPAKATAVKMAPVKRRSPITRAEGERRLIDAATQLIQGRPISEVGVREIAMLADVNAGFVHTWFGSKNDLLVAVLNQEISQFVQIAMQATPGTPAVNFSDPKIVSTIRLLLWLNLEGVQLQHLLQNQIFLDTLTARYIDIEKLNPEIARATATIGIAIGLAAGTFAPMLDMDSVDTVQPVMQLWRHVLTLLAKYPPE